MSSKTQEELLYAALVAAAERAWQDEVILPDMEEYAIEEYGNKEEWIISRINEWIDEGGATNPNKLFYVTYVTISNETKITAFYSYSDEMAISRVEGYADFSHLVSIGSN